MDHEVDPGPSIKGQDEDRLAELGYKQELTRNWSLLHNFGVSFSIIVRSSLCFPSHAICIALRPSGLSETEIADQDRRRKNLC